MPIKKNTGRPGREPKQAMKEPDAVYKSLPGHESFVISRAVHFMGGRSAGFVGVKEEEDLIAFIKKGIPRKALDQLMLVIGLNSIELASVMHTSDRTLRRYKPSKLLNPGQSERVIELARLYSRGEEVFENLDAFKEWMESTVKALGNKKPKEFLDTSLGIEMLNDELGRIEQGVFA